VQFDLRSLIEHVILSFWAWRGMVLIHLIGCLGVQVWSWRSLSRRLKRGTITQLQGALRHAGWAFLPVLLFVGGCATMVGIQHAALLACPALGLSVLGTMVFAIRCAFVDVRQDTA
jgi:hypothetical protein